jgi:hypothetical protein
MAILAQPGSSKAAKRSASCRVGLPRHDADDREWLAYAFYIGHDQLGQNTETALSRPRRLDRLVELLSSEAPNQAPR